MVLIPVNLSDPNYTKPPHFEIAFHIFVVSGDEIKTGRLIIIIIIIYTFV